MKIILKEVGAGYFLEKKGLTESSSSPVIPANSGVIQEAFGTLEKRGKYYRASGLIQHGNILNQNGRIYPTALLQREVRNYQRKIKSKTSIGELDHPEGRLILEWKTASHWMPEVWMDGDIVYGTIELLDNPIGRDMEGIFEQGVTVAVSSRGLGSVAYSDNATIIQDDYNLICWDLVIDPSTPRAFLDRDKGLVSKGVAAEGKSLSLQESQFIDNWFGKQYKIQNAVSDYLIFEKNVKKS